MKQILLSSGKTSLVDDEDFEYLNLLKWNYNGQYAVRTQYFGVDSNGKRIKKNLWMHRLIMDCPKDKEIDHINGDRVDNRKQNLRIVDHYQNSYNLTKYKNNTSGYKGVYHETRLKNFPYIAQIRVNGKLIVIGKYKTIQEAVIAYNTAAKEYHGDYARLNIL